MNVIDTLVTENLALLALMVDKHLFEESNSSLALFYAVVISIFSSLPLLGLTVFIAYRIFKRIRVELHPSHTKRHALSSNEPTASIAQQDIRDGIDDSDQELPDRMLHPQEYNIIEMNCFENVNYVRASWFRGDQYTQPFYQ
jgi:hypothetical protein